jgi:hypothetical protein
MDKCPKCQTRLSWIAGEPAHPDNQYCDNCGWPHELAGEEAEKALANALPDTIQVSRAEYEALKELSDAFKQNNRAFRNIETGEIKYLIVGANTDGWEDVVIIPDISNAAIDAAINMPNGEGRE